MKNRFVSEEVINPLVDPQLSYEHLETLFEIQQALRHGGFRETMLAQESAESIGVTFTEEGLIETIWNGIKAFFKAIADFFRKLFGMKSKQEANFEKAMKIAEDLEHTGITKVRPGEICSANREAIRKEVADKLTAELGADAQAVAGELDKLTAEFDDNVRVLIGLQRLGVFPDANDKFVSLQQVFFGRAGGIKGVWMLSTALKEYQKNHAGFETDWKWGRLDIQTKMAELTGSDFNDFLRKVYESAGLVTPKDLYDLDANILQTAVDKLMSNQALDLVIPKPSGIEAMWKDRAEFRKELVKNREINSTLDQLGAFNIKPPKDVAWAGDFADHIKKMGKAIRAYFSFMEACDRLETKASDTIETYMSIAVMLEMVRK